jgi:hypothetical protein
MSNMIIVNFTHPLWNIYAVESGPVGLGTPYGIINGTTELSFQRESLVRKQAELNQEIGFWQSFGPESAVERLISMDRSNRRRLFGRRLYDVLFQDNTKTNSEKDRYWGSEGGGKLGALSLYDNRQEIYRILNSYITLINQILNITPGLSRIPANNQSTDVPVSLIPVATATKTLTFDFITVETVEIPLGQIIKEIVSQLTTTKTSTFFDSEREYKTVLNFGDGYQYLVEAWRQGRTPHSIQLKLFTPVAPQIQLYDTAYIVRDVANSVIDVVEIESMPAEDTSRMLRPRNMAVANSNATQTAVNGITLETSNLSAATLGIISGSSVLYEDRIFNEWYTEDFASSELNINHGDYSNFIMFGSAKLRLDAFRNKLSRIEIAPSANVSSSNVVERKKALEIQEIKRNFDVYERFLYYGTNEVPYSASVFYTDTGVEYNPSATWPKSGSILYTTNSPQGTQWFATQSAIAERFDEFNVNSLTYHLPQYIQENKESAEFLTFVHMFGHMMDNIKVYIDQFPTIYSTSPNPLEDLTMDQVYEVATSFGLKLPNAYALEKLQSFVSSIYDSSGARTSVAETWKRYIHSSIYLLKSKGTKTSVDGIMNVYGINSPLVQLKESSYPSVDNYVTSDEATYGLTFTAASENVGVPLVSSSITTDTLQVRFIPNGKASLTLLNGDTRWAVDVVPHPAAATNQYGKIHIVSGSARTLIASSSYFRLFGDDYTHIMLRSQSSDMTIVQTDGDQVLYRETLDTGIPSTEWNNTQYVYLGGSGSIQLTPFRGIVDEVLAWDGEIPDELFIRQAYDPGSYYGTSYTTAHTSLYTHLGFSQPLPSITSSATNESPSSMAASVLLPTVGFTTESYTRIVRPVKQFVPVVGAVAYTNKKISVAPPPVFNESSLDANGTPTLSRVGSILPLSEKKYTGGHDMVSFAVSPIDFINQNIMRTMGYINTNYLIGSPKKIQGDKYTEVDEVYRFFLEKYNTPINPNEYIRFFKNVIAGPVEQIEDTLPARAYLVDGVVIESHILDRKRNNTVKAFRVDGSGTNTFLTLVNSASNATTNLLAGAYSFDATYKLYDEPNTTKIPDSQKLYQFVNPSDVTPATSSLIADSGIAFLESSIDVAPSTVSSEYAYLEGNVVYIAPTYQQTGYPRNPFIGIPASGTFPATLDGEENTVIPFYDIPPRANFDDVGTITYFHRSNGVYRFPSAVSKFATEQYLAKFVENRASPLDQVYSPITLLPPDTIPTVPGRETTVLKEALYPPNEPISGTIKLARLFSLVGVLGEVGLRVTLTRASDNVLLFDGVLDGDPDVNPYLLIQTFAGIINYTITNTTSATLVSEVRFEYFQYDPLGLIPRGYLPRHYKFSKTTNTPTLRRSYLGCRQVFCQGPCPPGVIETESDSPWTLFVTPRSGGTVNNPVAPSTGGPATGITPTRTSDGGRVGDGVVTFGGAGPLGDE